MGYMDGWKMGAKMVNAGFPQKECRSYALFLMRHWGDDMSRGFLDAVMSGIGA